MKINDIVVRDRLRKEMGDIDELANSIKEFGLIQPIVLVQLPDSGVISLLAGGRRLTAVKRLGWQELEHGRDFIWRHEASDSLRLRSIELEENLKRKELSWQEQLSAKKKLLELMQSIHGAPRQGGLTRSERLGATPTGFGINKLAAMLGESNAQTSKDIELATMVEKLPHLAKAETKESARRQLSILGAVASMSQGAKARAAAPQAAAQTKLWTLYEGDFRANIAKIGSETVDLIYTDLPFGIALSQMSKHSKGNIEYSDGREDIVGSLEAIAHESYRLLHEDRFAVFFFGFNYYPELLDALAGAGFNINPVPVIWYKHTRSTENPNIRYANAYDSAIVVMKGSPVFIRPGNTNVVDIPAVLPSQKLQIAQQPVELVERFLLDMTTQGAHVVDFCAGSGTTGVACVKNKRSVTLFEREPAACELIKARLGVL